MCNEDCQSPLAQEFVGHSDDWSSGYGNAADQDTLVSYQETLSEEDKTGELVIDTMGEDSDNDNSQNARKTKLPNYPQNK